MQASQFSLSRAALIRGIHISTATPNTRYTPKSGDKSTIQGSIGEPAICDFLLWNQSHEPSPAAITGYI